jgi:hypothetical protein
MRRGNRLLAALTLALVAPPAAVAAQEQPVSRPNLALMGTIPIYWGEAAGLDDLLNGDAPPHWARAQLEDHFTLAPLDYLSAEALAGYRYLLMAQPRGLSPEENVALDAWVRDGGQLLLFADPMMTGESRFHLGDRRRPQDVALLSPILAHWGLELTFDLQQAAGPQQFDHHGTAMPVNMRGTLRYADDRTLCNIPGEGLLAHCVIGQGQAMVIADAAMLDLHDPSPRAPEALHWLVSHIFGDFGDHAGNDPMSSPQGADSMENTGRTDPADTHHGRSSVEIGSQ